jgi:GT2 family glycosyltransferase
MIVTAIVVTYNGIQWIEKCITSLLKSSYKINIIVIDNGSTDGTLTVLENYTEIQVIKTAENLGFAKANNEGIVIALKQNADYIFLLNQDAWVENDTIEKLVDVAKANEDYGVISPMHLNGSYTALDIKFANYLIPENCKNIVSDLYMNKLKPLYEAVFVNAAAWLLSAKVIKQVGLFDSSFFFYGEDSNYLQRVQYKGYKTGITTMCTICHDREERKGKLNISNYNKWQHSESLVILLNINRSFKKSILLFLKEQVRLTARHLYEMKFTMIRYPVNQVFYFFTHISKLKAIRKSYTQYHCKHICD